MKEKLAYQRKTLYLINNSTTKLSHRSLVFFPTSLAHILCNAVDCRATRFQQFQSRVLVVCSTCQTFDRNLWSFSVRQMCCTHACKRRTFYKSESQPFSQSLNIQSNTKLKSGEEKSESKLQWHVKTFLCETWVIFFLGTKPRGTKVVVIEKNKKYFHYPKCLSEFHRAMSTAHWIVMNFLF